MQLSARQFNEIVTRLEADAGADASFAGDDKRRAHIADDVRGLTRVCDGH